MSTYQVIPFDWSYGAALLDNLCTKDLEEVSLNGHTPIQAVLMGTLLGPTYIALQDSRPIGVFGATYMGSLWGLFTRLDIGAKREVARQAPFWVRRLMQETRRPILFNRTLASHRTVHKWLKRIPEATVEEPHMESMWVHFEVKEKASASVHP